MIFNIDCRECGMSGQRISPTSSSVKSAIQKVGDEKWAVQRARYMTLETIAPLSDDPIVSLPAVAA